MTLRSSSRHRLAPTAVALVSTIAHAWDHWYVLLLLHSHHHWTSRDGYAGKHWLRTPGLLAHSFEAIGTLQRFDRMCPFLKLLVHYNADALPTRCWTSANLGKTLLRTAFLELLVHIYADALPIRCWTSANLGRTLLRTAFLRLLVSFNADALPPPVLGLSTGSRWTHCYNFHHFRVLGRSHQLRSRALTETPMHHPQSQP
jgi:hypothetical protein